VCGAPAAAWVNTALGRSRPAFGECEAAAAESSTTAALGKLPRKGYVCAYVDLWPTDSEATFVTTVAKTIADDAFNRNMELGMLVRDETTVLAIAEHFRELIQRGVLVEVKPTNT
jgi:hypothetical protein